jgi:hypothetical protein
MSYDPTKRYSWSPDEKIELTGQEFAMVLNAVRSVLNLPEAPAILLADKANMILDGIMAKNVEAGIIKPADEPSIKIKNEETND